MTFIIAEKIAGHPILYQMHKPNACPPYDLTPDRSEAATFPTKKQAEKFFFSHFAWPDDYKCALEDGRVWIEPAEQMSLPL